MAYNLALDMLSSLELLYLLSAPLTIPLICCQINRFRRASRCGEAMTRRRKEERRAGTASRGMCSAGVVAPLVCGYRGIPARGVVPDRDHPAGSAVDARRDTIAGVRRAARAADGGVVDVPHTLSGSPRALCMTAQRVVRFHFELYPQLLATKEITSRQTVGITGIVKLLGMIVSPGSSRHFPDAMSTGGSPRGTQ